MEDGSNIVYPILSYHYRVYIKIGKEID
jgi:hypothetical protein